MEVLNSGMHQTCSCAYISHASCGLTFQKVVQAACQVCEHLFTDYVAVVLPVCLHSLQWKAHGPQKSSCRKPVNRKHELYDGFGRLTHQAQLPKNFTG